jgi:hypothetical protein
MALSLARLFNISKKGGSSAKIMGLKKASTRQVSQLKRQSRAGGRAAQAAIHGAIHKAPVFGKRPALAIKGCLS